MSADRDETHSLWPWLSMLIAAPSGTPTLLALAKRTSAEWILEGDIRACFDAFDHEWLVEHTPTDQGRLRAWLKSGFMEQRRLFPTDRGAAQGGVISPTVASIDHLRAKVKMILQKGQQWPQSEIIRMLNPIIRGWGNYFRHVVSQVVFHKLDQRIWCMTWNWARRRHLQKNPRWIKERYFHHQGARTWAFTDGCHTLVSLARIPIRRHVHVRSGTNPYEPQDADYFQQRRAVNRAYPSHQGLAFVR